MIGIPYAKGIIENGGLVKVCPICGQHCPEHTDNEGEQTTHNYATHYAKEHDNAV